MRFALLVLLLALLAPDRITWSGPGDTCCGDECACDRSEGPSCCASREPQVKLVQACGCGRSHGPRTVEQVSVVRALPPLGPALLAGVPEWGSENLAEVWVHRVPAPEPPPPRTRVGVV